MSKYLAVYGKPRYLGILNYDGELAGGDTLIVESQRGEELAVVAGELTDDQETAYRQLRNTSEHGDTSSKNGEPVVTDLSYIAHATQDDTDAGLQYRNEENDILHSAKQLLKPHDLDMKLIDVEFLRHKRKLFFYFSSEQRVDFRAYVRDLAREFKTRIELRQIGVRDEAKIIRGVGPCGLPCCCSYWLNQFAPICIKMVKEQNLALNPSKISGICGRLMCCMCFEHNVYREVWSKLPNPGTKIKTPNGNVVVAGVEVHTNNVRCFVPGRGEIKVPVDDFTEFKETVMSGKDWIVQQEPEETLPKLQNVLPGYFKSSNAERPKRTDEPKPERKRAADDKSDSSERDSKTVRKKKRGQRKLPSTVKEAAAGDGTRSDTGKQHSTEHIASQDGTPHKPRRSRLRRGRSKKTEQPSQATEQGI